MLAGIITCGKCGNTLVTGGWRSGQTAPSKQHFYRCLPLPGRPERGGLSVTAPGEDVGVTSAMAQITEARQRMEDMARDYGAGLLTRAELHVAKTAALNTITDAERRGCQLVCVSGWV